MVAPYNRQEIQDFVTGERKAQNKMDAWYQNNGFEIINRTGNKIRDLVLSQDGENFKVEEKCRNGDFGDFLIEILQCMITEELGWFYTEKPDVLVYVICNSDWLPITVYWIDFIDFKNWYFNYLKSHTHQSAIISSKGKGLTLNLSVSWSQIPTDICEKFSYSTASTLSQEDIPF